MAPGTMSRSPALQRTIVAAFVVVGLGFVHADRAHGSPRFHASLSAGIADPLTRVTYSYHTSPLSIAGGELSPIAGKWNASQLHGAFRASLGGGFDLSLDLRRLRIPRGSEVQQAIWFGPGVRHSGGSGRVRSFVQANVFAIKEREEDDPIPEDTQTGEGFGLVGGADIGLSDLVSIPVEASLLVETSNNGTSVLGVQAGLSLHVPPPRPAMSNGAGPAAEQPADRLAVSLGYAWHTGDLLRLEDLTRAGHAGIGYRHPLGKRLELAFDLGIHASMFNPEPYPQSPGDPPQQDRNSVQFCGPGLRWTAVTRDTRPFVQASVLAARESRRKVRFWSDGWSGIGPGWAVMAGFEPRIGKRWSLPIEMMLLRARPVTDVASTGVRVGIAREIGRPGV